MQVAAVVGRTCRVADLAELTGQRVTQLLGAVEALLDADVLEWDGDDLRFRHEAVWSAVLAAMPGVLRDAVTADCDRLLGRRVAADRSADELTRSLALVRGALARPGAARYADDLHGLLANLLLLKGDATGARAAAERVHAASGRLADEATATRLAALALAGDRRAEGVAEAVLVGERRAEGAAEAVLAGDRRVGGVAEAVLAGDRRADGVAEAVSAGERGAAGAAVAALVLSNLKWRRGLVAESLHLARAQESRVPHWRLWQRLALADKLGSLRRLDEAHALLRATRDDLGPGERDSYGGCVDIVEAALLLVEGRLEEAAALAERGIAACRTSGVLLLNPHAHAVLAAVALRTGDVDRAAALLAETVPGHSVRSVLHDWVSLLVTARRYGPERAAAAAASTGVTAPTGVELLVAEPAAAAWLVRTATAADDPDLARRVVARAEGLAAANPAVPTVVAAAAHARALLEKDPAALAAVVHTDPWAAALARRDRADLGEPPESNQAWDTFSGVERAIARLVAEGMTNRQIATRVRLSPHTVNYHLRGLFRRLGINSRAELVRHVPAMA
ncbi:regulatory LuxR family protein [Saccharothrix variisporea]|uniref:Regulatory LuxR family protein n=1 Tax=Saccharothrix variisporea TaxID=543527 RepID=A0A495XCC0_9PSEU|nr:regulatory LuxR family protein [Saccharothrix variisporea]